MKFRELPADILTIRVKPTNHAAAPLRDNQTVLSVNADPTRPDEFEICLPQAVVLVTPVAVADTRRLHSDLASGRAALAQLANPAADGSIELQIAFFAGRCLEMGGVEIGVDESVENAFARIEHLKGGVEGDRLYRRLDQLCCFHQGDRHFFFLTAGPAIDRELGPESTPSEPADEEPENDDDAEEADGSEAAAEAEIAPGGAGPTPKPEPTRKNSFCVTGDRIRFVATETVRPDGESIFTITRLTRSRNRSDRAVRLVRGKLSFVDWTHARRIELLAKAQLAALTQEDGSYLKRWDEFGEREGEILLKSAREIGALQYGEMKQNRDGTVTVRILQALDSALFALAEDEVPEVEVVDDLPDYLRNANLTFREFVGAIAEGARDAGTSRPRGGQKPNPHFTVLAYDAGTRALTLEAERLPTAAGTLILSLAGEIPQIKRRIEARRAILEGRSVISQLGLLIEEMGQITPPRPLPKIRPLTAFVRAKIFPHHPPTPMQEKAIDVALNTPDIALIQGPPGTGKTTVIAAILERLNEMADQRGASTKGAVLITSFQHDAVENAISRISLNGIPTPKFGKRSGTNVDGFDAFERNLEGWCGTLATELRARIPQLDEIEQETTVKHLCLQYLQAPTRVLAANLAAQIASLGIPILGEDRARRAANLAKRLSREDRPTTNTHGTLDAVRRLRIRPASFADDGPERATEALDDLKGVLEEDEYAMLDAASLWRREDGVPPFLKDLAALKKKLLVRFTAPPVFRVEKQNDEVIALAEEAIQRIKAAGYSAKDAKSAALAEFLAELESNPDGMINAVSDYSFAFAATCQQSVNKKMLARKGITDLHAMEKIEFEYVIVDEAARVSPRDLMIAMTLGKRVILVGDHRQLPHLIDDEVARQMEEGETGEREADWLKKSMFEYLFSERLKTLQEIDGFTRQVTLDTQYRMHPILGDLISRNFYERFDASEKFGPGRPASDFAHDLPGTDGRPAAWLEVPAAKGGQKRDGKSWVRHAEAVAIANQLKTWIHSEAGKHLSYGVISFYKAQAKLIKTQLGNVTDDDEKLRIGTVDSFQGMEFDVVFLSIVRTVSPGWKPRDNDREKQAVGLFGHLCLYNRLNVSMSRQKKLLVLTGDCGLLRHPLAVEYIPGLVNFLELCQTEGRVLQCR